MWACGQNLDQCAARTIDFGGDDFTGQRIGDKDQAIRALRDALAARSQFVDGKPRHHCENWLPVFGRTSAAACKVPAGLACSDAMHGVEKGMRVALHVKGGGALSHATARRPRRKQYSVGGRRVTSTRRLTGLRTRIVNNY